MESSGSDGEADEVVTAFSSVIGLLIEVDDDGNDSLNSGRRLLLLDEGITVTGSVVTCSSTSTAGLIIVVGDILVVVFVSPSVTGVLDEECAVV